MSKDIIGELADDIAYYSGHIVGYEDSRDIAEKLLSDPNWEIRYSPPVPSQQDAAEAALTTAHIDEIAQRVAALLKERL